MARIRLLGGVSGATDDGRPVAIGPAKCQTVLAALALSAGTAIPVGRLVELVWGQDPPRTADKTLQTYVGRLRKGLGADTIVRTGTAYRLDVPADAVDVGRFQRQLDAGDVEAALAEWAGMPLAGLDAPGLTAAVDRLVEQWLGAVEMDLERRVGTDAAAAIGPLRELTASHPFRERLWALLMTALYRAGRQADALEAFQRARQHLVDELGVEPGPRLRELETLILEHDERLAGDVSSTGPASGRPRGTVTFGYCEVEGSTRLWATHRQKTAAAMARLDELVRATVDRHGGYVFAPGGEAFGVAFHRADDAAAWATQLQATMRNEPWPGGVELRLRVGLHTGETEEQATGYFGPTVTTAARLAAAGHGGQTLLSAVTAGLLDRDDLRSLGTYRLDGVVAEQHLFQLGDGEHPPLRTQERRRGNLPLGLARLIGRDEALAVIGDALATSPVVTLVGPAGIGKTRLALAAARMSADGDRGEAWLIDLAAITSASDVPRAVADTLKVSEQPARTLTQTIVSSLQSRSALLVLDNCEHVIDGAADLAQAIAQRCPSVRVLATSREGLGLGNEQRLTVTPLDPTGPAIELFNERARAVSPAFDPKANRAAVAVLCERLDGLPLAIELAAARTTSLEPDDLVARLDDQLRLLTRRRGSVERHRTLRLAIQWSYDLLTGPEQELFQRLSAFAGPFDVAAAARMAADPRPAAVEIDDLLAALVERSILVVESGPFGRRFRLLEAMRQFAAERLSEHGHADPIAGRHAQWCLDQINHIHQLLTGPGEIEGVARLGEAWPNLRAALDRACAARDHELADALVRPVAAEITLRRQSEIGDWAERILAITPPDDEDRVVFWTTCAAHRYMHSGDREAYETLAHRYDDPDHPLLRYTHAYLHEDSDALSRWSPEAVAWLRRRGDDHLAALTELAGVASGLMGTGRFEELEVFLSARADRYRAQGPPTLLTLTLVGLGYGALFQGKLADADQHFDELASIDVPDRTFSATKPIEARAAFKRGNRLQAFRILRTHIDDLLAADNTDVARLACVEFVSIMATIDRLPDAARVLGYLQTTGGFGALATTTLVADTASKIAEHALHQEQALGRDLNAHDALAHMRDVLQQLGDNQQIAT